MMFSFERRSALEPAPSAYEKDYTRSLAPRVDRPIPGDYRPVRSARKTSMKNAKVLLVLAAALMSYVGCKQEESPPPQAPYQPYPQPVPTQPAPAPTAAPAPTPAPTTPAPAPVPGQPAPAGSLSQPSPMALPCTADANCLTHRCNTQFGKCAWPCQTDNDCMPGNGCMAGACVPKAQ